jgi:DNA-binding CsgD family transcriptional regulator
VSRHDPEHTKSEALGLTRREAEVLAWVAKGKTNEQIGLILGISVRTVQKHLEHVFSKLGVETRTAAAAATGLA